MSSIDYSGPGATCNRNTETGIRYGIMPLHRMGEFAHESFEAEYDACCPRCQADWPSNGIATEFYPEDSTRDRHARRAGYYARCPACEALVKEDDTTGDEPSRHVLHAEGYAGMLDSSGDAWVFCSPYFTHAAFCSPCAPGACYLASPEAGGARAYCFGPEWFDEHDPCPYPIYSVATGELVQPGEAE